MKQFGLTVLLKSVLLLSLFERNFKKFIGYLLIEINGFKFYLPGF